MLEMQRVELSWAGLVAVERDESGRSHLVWGVSQSHIKVLSMEEIYHSAAQLDLWQARVIRIVHRRVVVAGVSRECQ